MPPVSLSLAEALGVPQPTQGSPTSKMSLNLESALTPLSMEPQKVNLPNLCLDTSPEKLKELSGSTSPISLHGPSSVPYPNDPPGQVGVPQTLDDILPVDDSAENYKDGAAALLLPKMLRFESLGEEDKPAGDIPNCMLAGSPSDEETPFGQSRDGHCVPFPPGLQPPPNTPSHGSVLHEKGTCRPCAWFHKPGGCKNGFECGHCHLCPDGEIKARKRAKQTVMRLGLATPKVSSASAEAESSMMALGIISPKAQVTRPAKASLWSTPKRGSLSEEESQTTAVGSEQEMSDGSHHSPEAGWSADPLKVEFAVGENRPEPMLEEYPSEGSQLHGTGACRPCAWFWKASGCQNGADCKHCHLCDSGEIQRRRKMKQSMMRMGLTSPKSAEAQSKFALNLSSLI